MATKQFLGTRYQSFKNDGTVNAGGKVYFYEPGTSTAKTTYSDSALTVSNANPVILNSSGSADIWYDGDADVSVYDSTDVLVDSYPNINPSSSSSTVESNLVSNGSFEDGSTTVPSNWTRSAPPALGSSAQDLDSSHGLYSWKFTSGGNGAGSLITTDYFNVAVGRTFNVIWQMKSSVADVRNLVEVVWYDDADVELSASSLYDNSTTNPTSWTTKSVLVTPVSNAVRAKLRITGCHSSDTTTGSTWFDGIQVNEAFVSGKAVWLKEGANVVAAADCDIWALGDGNTVHVTGNTSIVDWGTAPRAGASMLVIFDGTPTLTYNATTNDIEGAANITMAAGDSVEVYAASTSAYQIRNISRNSVDEVVVSSATNTNIADIASENVYITGTTTIALFGTIGAGVIRRVRFGGILELTHSSFIILPVTPSITTAANDTAEFQSLGGGIWICTSYKRANGTNLLGNVSLASGNLTGASVTITNIPNNYSMLALHLLNASHDSGVGNTIRVQASTNNGSSYDTTVTNYRITGTTEASLILSPTVAAANGMSSTLILSGYQAGTWTMAESFSHDGATFNYGDGAYIGSTSAINALRIIPSSGNLDAGTYVLYGIQ